MTGLEVLERIRGVDPHVKVVLSSGYRAGEEDESDRFSEASAFLSKPYRAESLIRIIRDVLDGTSS
jgi:DNA-binding NtrC family response regulator